MKTLEDAGRSRSLIFALFGPTGEFFNISGMMNNDDDKEGANHDLWLGVAVACAVIGGFTLLKGGGGLKKETRDLVGKNYIVTGANSGIGKATAAALANRGATVIMGCRNTSAGEEARQSIISSAPGCDPKEVRVKRLDLSSFKSIQKFVSDVQDELPSVHCLINNAGALVPAYEVKHGLELTVLTNYYGPLYLATQLLPLLRQAGGSGSGSARVVNVSSRLEKGRTWGEDAIRLGPTGLITAQEQGQGQGQGLPKYSYMTQYGNSKFLQLLATVGQAEEYKKDGVVVHAVTPGMVHTGLSRSVLWGPVALVVQPLQMMFLRTPAQGAAPVVYAATAAAAGECTGKYWQADKTGVCCEEDSKAGRSELSRSLKLARELLQGSQKQIAAAIAQEEEDEKKKWTEEK